MVELPEGSVHDGNRWRAVRQACEDVGLPLELCSQEVAGKGDADTGARGEGPGSP